jgi:hypothetical protein
MVSDVSTVEGKTSSSSGQVVSPMNIQLSVFCEINPENPEKPFCHIRYVKPPFLGISEVVEDTIDVTMIPEEGPSPEAKKSQTKGHSKKSTRKDEDEDDEPDTKDHAEEDSDEEDDEHQPILECISRAYPDD